MIPTAIREFQPNSKEDIMFDALEKLPKDYIVIHSFNIVSVIDGKIHESETDFVVFHPKKGILCIEAKAGHVSFRDGDWYYGSGIKMGHGGPFHQASQNKWKLKRYFEDHGMEEFLKKCKLLHAVWFPTIASNDLIGVKWPSDADRALTLTSEALDNPEPFIDEIFNIQTGANVETNLTALEAKTIVNSVLCPSFDLVVSMRTELDYKRQVFNRLLKEQSVLLNFLEEQPNAIINGVAGTGKTMIALEKARRHGEKGEKVLFLCFNKLLCDHLRKNYAHDNVYYSTIDGFACNFCNTSIADFELLYDRLEETYYNQTFPYKHIIIDEGQDFGQERFINIIELLEMIVLQNEKDQGTFYLFYDKNQLVQGFNIPKYITDADCKLTLYKNCRNTENIAITSMRPLGQDKRPKLFEGCIEGDTPRLFISNDQQKQIDYVNQAIKECINNKITDIVILTCATEEKSVLSPYVVDGEYRGNNRKIRMTTSRKFKGLEADAIILVDVSKDAIIDKDNLLFYVGASRARFQLYMVSNLSDAECIEIATDQGYNPKRPQKAVASYLNAYLSL